MVAMPWRIRGRFQLLDYQVVSIVSTITKSSSIMTTIMPHDSLTLMPMALKMLPVVAVAMTRKLVR